MMMSSVMIPLHQPLGEGSGESGMMPLISLTASVGFW